MKIITKTKKTAYRLLKKSEKYFKTDMIYLAKGGFWLTLGDIVSSLAGLGLTIAFANLLDPEVYGTFKYVIAFIPILSIPTLNGINTAIVKAVAQGYSGTIKPALRTKIRWGILGAVAGLAVASYYFYQGNNTLGISFLLMSAFLPFFETLNIWTQYLNGLKDFKRLGKYTPMADILRVLIMLATIYFTQNLFIILFVHYASNVLIRFIFLKITLKKHPPEKDKEDPTAINLGKHLSLMGVIGIIGSRLDSILIFHFLGPIQLAVYTFSLKPVRVIQKPLQSLTKLTFPKVSEKKDDKEFKKTLPRKLLKFFLVLIPIVLVYILIAPTFYNALFPEYTDAIIYSQVFALSLLLFPKRLLGQFLTAQNEKKKLYVINIITNSTKIILLLILLPIYGLWGAIVSLISLEIISLGIVSYFFITRKRIKDENKRNKS
jgi:O-antigen/teichoic acid export membrane protein